MIGEDEGFENVEFRIGEWGRGVRGEFLRGE